MHSSTRGGSDAHPFAPWPLGPRTSAVLAASALSATAYTLGAAWLGEDVAGLPVGAWLAAGAGLATHLVITAPGRVQGTRSLGRSVGRAVRSSRDSSLGAAVQGLAAGAGDVAGLTRQSAERLARRITSRYCTLRIGLDVTEHERAALRRASGDERTVAGTPVDITAAKAGLVKDGPVDCRSRDALLRRAGDATLHLFVPAHPERPAAWPDWSRPLPTGYAGLFPVRLDTARTKLGVCDIDDPAMAALVARLTVAAAVLGRAPARLAGPGVAGAVSLRPTLPNWSACVESAMESLGAALLAIDPTPAACEAPCAKAAARLVTAWLATSGGESPAIDRLAMARAAARFCDGEPEVAMRVAALEIAAGHPDRGLHLLAQAGATLRASGAECETDPVAFIMSEAELGGDALAVGRIAAGVTLAWATADPGSAAYLREDLLDDLSHTPWLEQRPADLDLIERILDRLSGRADTRPQRRVGEATRNRRRSRRAA